MFGLLEAFLYIQASAFDDARIMLADYLERARSLEHQLSVQISLVLLGLAELGVGNLAAAQDRFEELREWQARQRILMDWIWKMPLQLGISRQPPRSGHGRR